MSSINTEEFQSTLNEFEQLFGVSWNSFVSSSEQDQLATFMQAQGRVDSTTAQELFASLYEYFVSLNSVYENMMENGNALERAQGEIYLQDIATDVAAVQNLSTTWGESEDQNSNDNQESNGNNISYSLNNAYDGQEVTLDLSEGDNTSSNWISDPHADNPNMIDTDGDGYKDTEFYVSSRSEYDVVNLEGNVVNVDTDGDGDVDQYDGLSADYGDIPTCTLDLNGGTWELVDYNPETLTYRLKVITGEEPDLIETYINIVGPCYIAPIDGTPPSEETLRSYPEDVMRVFKESASAPTTVGDILYGEEIDPQSRTVFLDSQNYNNEYRGEITDDMWEAEATVTVEFESEEADNFYLDCQNADASFEWNDDSLYIYLTNEDGQTVTYILKGFETAGMNGYDTDVADAIYLSNVDISQEEFEKLYYMGPGIGSGSTDFSDSESLGAAFFAFSIANHIYIDDEEDDEGNAVSMWNSDDFEIEDD